MVGERHAEWASFDFFCFPYLHARLLTIDWQAILLQARGYSAYSTMLYIYLVYLPFLALLRHIFNPLSGCFFILLYSVLRLYTYLSNILTTSQAYKKASEGQIQSAREWWCLSKMWCSFGFLWIIGFLVALVIVIFVHVVAS